MRRVPAAEIEAVIIAAVRERLGVSVSIADPTLIASHVARVDVQAQQLVIRLADEEESGIEIAARKCPILVPWQKPPSKRRREILVPEGVAPQNRLRPLRAENRATLIASIAQARRWVRELLAERTASADSIAKREGCSVRKVNMTISLAFLAPDLVKAAIEGRLPYGMGVARLSDLPAEWSRQHQTLGLAQAPRSLA